MAKKGYTLKEMQAAVRDANRRMEPIHTHWQMLEALYRTGAQRELTMMDVNRILPFPVPGAFLRTVNMLLPHLSMVINSVAARDPKLIVTPVGGDENVIERNAMLAKNILEYFWKRTDATSTLRDMTQDMVVLGNGFAKVGWSYSETTIDRTAEDMQLEAEDLLNAAQEIATETGAPLDSNTLNEIVESIQLTQQLVESDEPYVEYVSPYDILLPANARRINTARWVAQRLRLPIEELKNNDIFDKKAREDLKVDAGYVDPVTYKAYEEREEGLPQVFQQATVYEFYDMQARTLTVFQEDAEIPLYDGPIPYAHRYPPFVHMRNFSDGGQNIWAFGDVENVAGIQLMINEIMISELNDLKRVGNKYFINSKVLTPEMRKALSENKPDQVIPVDLPNSVGMNEVMVPVQRLATPADNFVMENKLQDYMQRIIGITDFQMGNISAANRVPATAAAAVEGGSTTRALDKMTNVEKCAREIATRMLGLCQQFLDNAKAIRIAGPDAVQWLEVSSNDIEGEFSIETEGGSTQAINPATRARQGSEMIQQIIPALASLGYDPEPALRAALSYMGFNPDHFLVRPTPPPAPPMPEGMGGMIPGMEGQLPPEAASMAGLQELGAPPVPAATEGGIVL
jgi:hypothetical protein